MRCCVVVDGGHVDSVRVTLGVWLWVAVDVVLVPVLVLRMSLVVPKVLVSRAVALISSDGRVVSDGVDDVFSVASTLIRMHMQNEYTASQTVHSALQICVGLPVPLDTVDVNDSVTLPESPDPCKQSSSSHASLALVSSALCGVVGVLVGGI